MNLRRLLPLLVLAAAAIGAVVLSRTMATQPEAGPPVAEPSWTTSAPDSAPKGPPFTIGTRARPEPVRWSGTFAYEQVPSGRFGTERTKARRSLSGSFTAVESTTGPASARETAVEARFELSDRIQSAAPVSRSVTARLTFTRDGQDLVVHRSIRLDAPADVLTELELFQAAFVQRFEVPRTAARVGERLPIDDAIDVADMFHRPALFLFKERAMIDGAITVPVEGGVWIGSKDGASPDEAAVLYASLTHARVAENGPKGPNAVTIDYRAKLDAARAIVVADGRVRRHTADLARKLRFTASDLDYVIFVRSTIAMSGGDTR